VLDRTGMTYEQGDILPSFVLPDTEGHAVDLQQVLTENRLVVVNVWATWCVPCRLEMPDLIEFYQKRKGQGVTLLAVSLDEDPQKVAAYLAKSPVPFPVLLDPDQRVAKELGVRALPTAFLIDKEGRIRFAGEGGRSLDFIVTFELGRDR
jgi:peroxiredoxin